LAIALAAPAFAAEPAASAGVTADADLGKLLDTLTSDDPSARKTAATSIEGLGADAVPAIAKELATERKVPPPAVAQTVKAVRDGDLGDTLLATKVDLPGWKPALVTTMLMRSLAHTGTTPAVAEIIRVGGDHGGAFRP